MLRNLPLISIRKCQLLRFEKANRKTFYSKLRWQLKWLRRRRFVSFIFRCSSNSPKNFLPTRFDQLFYKISYRGASRLRFHFPLSTFPTSTHTRNNPDKVAFAFHPNSYPSSPSSPAMIFCLKISATYTSVPIFVCQLYEYDDRV